MAGADETSTAYSPDGPPPAATSEDLPSGLIADRYRIERRIAAGGMGVVYAAHDLELHRAVAIKLIRAQTDSPRRRERFVREARAMARLRHPSVVTVYDLGVSGDRFFIVMELVEGGTLGAWLKAERRSWRDIVPRFLQAAQALAAAHAAGIVHRDFKSENVLIDHGGRVQVADFGVMRLLGDAEPEPEPEPRNDGEPAPATGTADVVGTPGHIAPEILEHRAVDVRADQFSFCVALFAALHGRRPFAGGAATDPLHETLGDVQPPPPGAAPAWLQRIVLRGLSREPADRFPSMSALIAELEKGAQRAGRWRIGILSTLVLVAAALAVVLGWRTRRHEAPRQLVERRLTADPPSPDPIVASLSHDGRRLAWSRSGSLTVRLMATGEEQPLALPPRLRLASLSWFADDVRLLATGTDDTGPVLEILATEAPPVVLARPAHLAALSPDERTIAVLRHEAGGPEELWLMAADGSSPRKLRELGKPWDTFARLLWSPDGRRLAVVDTADGSVPRLRVIDSEGGPDTLVAEDHQLLDLDGGVSDVWLADGRLAYHQRRPVGIGLVAVELDSTGGKPRGTPALIASFENFELRIHGRDDDGDLLVSRTVMIDNSNVLELAGHGSAAGEPRRFSDGDEWRHRETSFTADGASVFSQTFRSGRWQIFRKSIAGGPAELERTGAFDAVEAVPAPGGVGEVWLEAEDIGDQSSRRLMARSADGAVRLVAALEPMASRAFLSLRCARAAGHGCVLLRTELGQEVFSRIDPVTGTQTPIPAPGVGIFSPHGGWDLSPDGDEIAWVSTDGHIRAFAVSDGSKRLDLTSPGDFKAEELAYDASGGGFIVTGSSAASPMFRLEHVERQGTWHFLWGDDRDWIAGPLASPDGRRVAFKTRQETENLWLLSGL